MREQIQDLRSHPGFSSLAISRFISNVGNGIAPIALAFGVLSLEGATEKDLSFVMAVKMVPMLLFMLFGGVVGDRYKRNRVVGGSDMIGSLFAAVSAISLIMNFSSVALLALMGALFGFLNALWWPAMSGVLPEILPREKLQKGNAVISLMTNSGFVIGALIGGSIVTTFGSGWALLVDALSFFVAGVLVWNIDLSQILKAQKGSMFHELREGWREFVSRDWVIAMVIAFALINMAFESMIQVLGPLNYNTADSGPRYWSYNLAAITLGMMAGSALSLKIHWRRPLFVAMIVIAFSSIWDFSLALDTPLVISLMCAFFSGFAVDIFMVVWNTSLQSHIPEGQFSRVNAYDALGSFGIAPIGIAIAGPLAASYGVNSILFITGGLTFTASILSLTVKSVRHLEYREVPRA